MVKPTDCLTSFDILKRPYFYNQLIRSSSNRFLQRFISMLGSDAKILDVGCGPSTIVPAVYNVVRCDLNSDYSPDVVCSALQLQFDNDSFDGVVHSWVLEHLEEPRQALDECYRVLKPSGFLYLTTNMAWHLHETPRDFFRFTEYGLQYLLDKQRWEIVFLDATIGLWGTITQLMTYKIVALLQKFRMQWIHPLFTVPLQTIGLLLERKFYDTNLCAGYCVIARKV